MRYMFVEALSNIRHGGIVSFLVVFIITLTITIASTLILTANYLSREIKNLNEKPTIIAFL